MMAKMFYTLDEAKTALGKNEEEIKQLAREGRLREFRDGPRLMFKADQVDQLKNELAGGTHDQVDLGPSDSGIAIGLADSSRSSSGSAISLADTDGRSPAGGGMTLKEDTALAADLGLSGSIGGVPSPGRSAAPSAPSGTGLSGNQGSRSGIDVFQTDEVDRVDPGAQTAISPGINEQINLDAVGSGSGLLDLTRESDDTSLGAELLDEIAPSGSGSGVVNRRGPGDSGSGSGSASGLAELTEPRGGITRGTLTPVYVEAKDSTAPMLGGAALGASIVLIYAAFALISGIVGKTDGLHGIGDKGFAILAAIGIGVSIVFAVFGAILGKIAS